MPWLTRTVAPAGVTAVNAPQGELVERLSKRVSPAQSVPAKAGILFSLAEKLRSPAIKAERLVELRNICTLPPPLVSMPDLMETLVSPVPFACPLRVDSFRPLKLVSVSTLTTPATASAPYSAAAPSRSISTRLTAPMGSEFVLAVCTGTKFSVCVPGVRIRRRPLTSTNVFPVPTPRKLIEALSPRASFRLPVVRASWKFTSPACGSERKISSPEVLPTAEI